MNGHEKAHVELGVAIRIIANARDRVSLDKALWDRLIEIENSLIELRRRMEQKERDLAHDN